MDATITPSDPGDRERIGELSAQLERADTLDEKRRIGEEFAQLADLPGRGQWELPDDE